MNWVSYCHTQHLGSLLFLSSFFFNEDPIAAPTPGDSTPLVNCESLNQTGSGKIGIGPLPLERERHINMGVEANILVQPSSAMSIDRAICKMERREKQNLKRNREELRSGFREREGKLGSWFQYTSWFQSLWFSCPEIILDTTITLQ